MTIPQALTQLPIKLPTPIPPPTPSIRQAIELNAFVVYLACCWVDKKLGAIDKLPRSRKVRTATKEVGDWLYQIYRCCERIHSLGRRSGATSRDSIDNEERFTLIVQEFYFVGLQPCLRDLYPVPEHRPNPTKKADFINLLNRGCSLFKAFQKPSKEAHPTCPELALFVLDVIELAESNSRFRNEFFVPLRDSWREMIFSMNGWAMHTILTSRLEVQVGRGRNVRNLTPSYLAQLQALSRTEVLKPLPEGRCKS